MTSPICCTRPIERWTDAPPDAVRALAARPSGLPLRRSRDPRHSPRVHARWWAILAFPCACGGKAPLVVQLPNRPQMAELPSLPERPKNTLYRDEIESAKQAGLGHFFERIDLEPRGETDQHGRLGSVEGFQMVALRPARDWLSFDFAPGDVLTHINGVSVEHYSTWFTQFEGLSKADQIRVDLVRDGKPTPVLVRIAARAPATERRQGAARGNAGTPGTEKTRASSAVKN